MLDGFSNFDFLELHNNVYIRDIFLSRGFFETEEMSYRMPRIEFRRTDYGFGKI